MLEDGKEVSILHPEKRLYTVQRSTMTEAAIDAGFTRDLYVALGEQLDNGAWAVRVHVKPFVRWIWFGGLITAMGAYWRRWISGIESRSGARSVTHWASRKPPYEALATTTAAGAFSWHGSISL